MLLTKQHSCSLLINICEIVYLNTDFIDLRTFFTFSLRLAYKKLSFIEIQAIILHTN